MNMRAHRGMKETIQIAGLVLMALLMGCAGGTEVGNPTSTGVIAFDSNEALESYLKDQLASSVVPRNVADMTAMEGDFQAGSYTTTNLQEPGVDESDTVKTDGTHLYVARSGEVAIVRAMPSSGASVVERIPVSGTVDSLYLYHDLLVIFTMPEDAPWSPRPEQRVVVGMPTWISARARTGVLFYDVSNPAAPVKRSEVEIDGSLMGSRMVSGRLHVIQQFMPELPALDVDYDGTVTDQASAIQNNENALDGLTVDDLTPSYTVTDELGRTSADQPLVTYRNFYRPGSPEGGSIVTITTFDLTTGDLPFTSIGYVGDAHTVYASTGALFLVSNICEEKDGSWTSSSFIHRFDLADLSDISSGSVPGWIVNQFSLGEYGGVLRIATTDYTEDFSGFTNAVFCLKPDGERLKAIGRIDGITPGEKIYAARFIGARGYLVTFVQVDPLITLDLSDPSRPAILGELVLPGYSTYIHPVDDDRLVTLGLKTLEEGGWVLNDGLQLSLFDVSDPARPSLMDQVILGDRGTSSEALWNHKAFTFHTEADLIAFPVDLYEAEGGGDPWTTGTYLFSGLYVYGLDRDAGFSLLGRISTLADEGLFYSYWTRGIFMEDSVLAVNADAVWSAEASDIEHTLGRLDLD